MTIIHVCLQYFSTLLRNFERGHRQWLLLLYLWTLQFCSVTDFSMIALQHYNKPRQMEPVILVSITDFLYHLCILTCLFCSLAPVPETASWQLFAKRKCLRMRLMMKIWMKTLSTVVNQVCSLLKCELCSFSQGVWVVLDLRGGGGKRWHFSTKISIYGIRPEDFSQTTQISDDNGKNK